MSSPNKTIYDQLVEFEHRRQCDRNVSLFTPHQEAMRLLEEQQYRGNHIVQQCKAGEKLERIVSGIMVERTYSLKFNKRDREEYNHKVDDLTKVTWWARHLHRGSFLSWDEHEGGALRMLGIGMLVGGCTVATSSKEITDMTNVIGMLSTMAIYSTLGASSRTFCYGHPKYVQPRMWREIRYIDSLLQMPDDKSYK